MNTQILESFLKTEKKELGKNQVNIERSFYESLKQRTNKKGYQELLAMIVEMSLVEESTLETLAESMGLSEKQVGRHIETLLSLNLIEATSTVKTKAIFTIA